MPQARKPADKRRTRKGASQAPLPGIFEKLLASANNRFYARGNRVFFANAHLLFSGDRADEAPERLLLVARPVEGNGDAVSADEVARLIAALLSSTTT